MMTIKNSFVITMLISIALSTSHCSKKENLNNILGNNFKNVKLNYNYDFIGVSTHGEKFSYKEYEFTPAPLNKIVDSSDFFARPILPLPGFKSNSKIIYYYKWQKYNYQISKYANLLITQSELQGDTHVINTLNIYKQSNSSYLSYICTYPEGNYLFLIDMNSNKFIIIEKRG